MSPSDTSGPASPGGEPGDARIEPSPGGSAGRPPMSGPPSAGAPGPAGDPARAGDEAMSALLAQNWWAVLARGVLAILFGIVALAAPGAVLLSLALFFAAYLLVDGVFAIVAAVRAAGRHERWGLLLAEGVLNIAMGVIVALFPAGAVLAFVLVTAAWALLSGGLMLASAFKLTPEHGRWWLALGGVVSVVWGMLLVIAPMIGAVVLTWWFAGYAIAFGTFLAVLAFRLRGRRNLSPPASGASPPGP